MTTIVLNHIPYNELPEAWRTQLHTSIATQFTIHIEEEPPSANIADDPLFGMWRDREDMANVDTYIRDLRASRF